MVGASGLESRKNDAKADELVGTVINDRFRVIELIARGGMGSVYFATQTSLNRPVAIKVLHGVRHVDAESEESFRSRFLQEAHMLSRLQHPNIVGLLDYGLIQGLPGEQFFMAMEFLRGETLAQRLLARSRLGVHESLGIAHQIARGLREAHRLGFVHRDLKPSNVILVPEGDQNDIVKLVDFGIGKVLPSQRVPEQPQDPSQSLAKEVDEATLVGLVLGSPRYMSPEQIRCGSVDAKADIYSLGVILFQALTGRPPFEEKSEFELLLAHCLTPAPALSEVCPEFLELERLSPLVARMLEKDAAKRPTSDEFLLELSALEEELLSAPPSGGSSRGFISQRGTRESRSTLPPAAPVNTQGADLQSVQLETLGPTLRGRRLRGVALIAGLLGLPLVLGVVTFGDTKLADRVRAGGATTGITPPPSSGAEPTARGTSPAASPTLPPTARAEWGPGPGLPPSFALTIETDPQRATVTEGGRKLGVTPFTLSIDRRSVARGPRRFLVLRDGYHAYPIEQGDSHDPVRILVALASQPRARKAPTGPAGLNAVPGQSGASVDGGQVSSSVKRGDSNLEIRLHR